MGSVARARRPSATRNRRSRRRLLNPPGPGARSRRSPLLLRLERAREAGDRCIDPDGSRGVSQPEDHAAVRGHRHEASGGRVSCCQAAGRDRDERTRREKPRATGTTMDRSPAAHIGASGRNVRPGQRGHARRESRDGAGAFVVLRARENARREQEQAPSDSPSGRDAKRARVIESASPAAARPARSPAALRATNARSPAAATTAKCCARKSSVHASPKTRRKSRQQPRVERGHVVHVRRRAPAPTRRNGRRPGSAGRRSDRSEAGTRRRATRTRNAVAEDRGEAAPHGLASLRRASACPASTPSVVSPHFTALSNCSEGPLASPARGGSSPASPAEGQAGARAKWRRGTVARRRRCDPAPGARRRGDTRPGGPRIQADGAREQPVGFVEPPEEEVDIAHTHQGLEPVGVVPEREDKLRAGGLGLTVPLQILPAAVRDVGD